MTNRELIMTLLQHDLDADVKLPVGSDYCDSTTMEPVSRVASGDDGSVEIS